MRYLNNGARLRAGLKSAKHRIMAFKVGSPVQWKWAGGVVTGVVEEVFFASVVREIKGKKITRHGSAEKPAYLVRSTAGNLALKLSTELTATSDAQPQASKRQRRPDIPIVPASRRRRD